MSSSSPRRLSDTANSSTAMSVPTLEDVDADDVAAHRTDAGRDQTQRTGTVGEPHAHEHARRRVGVAALATVTLGSHTLSGHDQKRRSAECPRVSS